jgi:hypothetical protein
VNDDLARRDPLSKEVSQWLDRAYVPCNRGCKEIVTSLEIVAIIDRVVKTSAILQGMDPPG